VLTAFETVKPTILDGYSDVIVAAMRLYPTVQVMDNPDTGVVDESGSSANDIGHNIQHRENNCEFEYNGNEQDLHLIPLLPQDTS